MADENLKILLETAQGHIRRATLPENEAGNRELCWQLAEIFLEQAQHYCQKQAIKHGKGRAETSHRLNL